MPLEPFLVNLADRETRRYLKLKVELEVDSEGTAKELEKSIPASGTPSSCCSAAKPTSTFPPTEGKQQLKQEIKQKITEIPGGSKVSDVFFTEFVAQ